MAVLTFLGLAAWLYLPDILYSGPQGIHFIRQTDVLSFVAKYGQPSWNLFEPAVFNLDIAPIGGKSASEFPIIYFMLALGRHCLGIPFESLRLANLLIVLAGHTGLAVVAARYLGSTLRGALFSVWMFSSSVVVFYAANYLSDAGAYGAALCGLAFILEGRASGRRHFELIGVIALMAAGLLKTTMALYLVAYAVTLFPSTVPARTFFLKLAFSAILIVVFWNLYVIQYNNAHRSHYFMTWAEPLWRMDRAEVHSATKYITAYWWTKFHHPTSWHAMAVLALAAIAFRHRVHGLLGPMVAWSGFGTVAFIILFYRKFIDHDYYFLVAAPGISLAALFGFAGVQRKFLHNQRAHIGTLALLALVVAGMQLAKLNLERRYRPSDDPHLASMVLAHEISNVLAKRKVPEDARFIVLGDPTPNGALYYLKRNGWSYDERIQVVPDLNSVIALGADHLLVLGHTGMDLSRFRLMEKTEFWSLFCLNDQFENP